MVKNLNKKNIVILVIMKIILILIVLVIFSFGCISVNPNQASFEEFNSLKEKYGVENNFSPNTNLMNDYISELSDLKTRSSFNLSMVIDAELHSSKAFYYYSISNQRLSELNSSNCSLSKKNELITFLRLANKNAIIAKNKIDAILFIDLENIRENQSELMNEINVISNTIINEINFIC